MTRWIEIVLEASAEVAETLAEKAAASIAERHARPFLASGAEIEPESWPERVQALLAARSHHVVFSPVAPARELVREVREHGEKLGAKIDHLREIGSASFAFEAQAYAPEVAQKIEQDLIESPCEGVSIEELERSEERDPAAKGVELYAPAHDYVWSARGVVRGRLPAVLEMHRRARDLDFVHVRPVHLEAREIDLDELARG